ncbi:MAG: hypothetical protein ACR2HA_14185, partial [Nocardioides sp.]
MSDRPGLSIFDDDAENGSSADDPTQVFPAVKAPPAPSSTPGQSQPTSSTASQAAPSRPPTSAPATPATRPVVPPAGPGFPVVRRGGYDTAAVDRQMHTLAGEKAGLAASLDDARSKLAAREKNLAALESQMHERENPTYAGLGGRASEMLRLAEEQADEVLA